MFTFSLTSALLAIFVGFFFGFGFAGGQWLFGHIVK